MKSRGWIAVAGLILFGMLVALVWQQCQAPALGKAVLPDGTQVVFRGITYGKDQFDLAGPLPRWLARQRLMKAPPATRFMNVPPGRSVAWFSLRPLGIGPTSPGRQPSIELEFVGFRSAETVDFVIDPGKAKR